MKKRIIGQILHGTLEVIGLITVLYALYLSGPDLVKWWNELTALTRDADCFDAWEDED